MKKWNWAILVVLVQSQILGCASLLQPKLEQSLSLYKQGEYELDKAHAALLFKVSHMGFSKFVGRFNDFDASLDFDPENISQSSMQAVVEMGSLSLPDESFAEVLRGDKWFKTVQFPQAKYQTTEVLEHSDNHIVFMGELTFLGQTQPVELSVEFNGAGFSMLTQSYTLGFDARMQFSRSAFGLDNYVPTIGDDVVIEVYAEFQRN